MKLDKAESGFGYLINAYKWGGPYMHLITFFLLVAFAIAVFKVYEISLKKNANNKLLDFIRMSGSLSLAIGFMSQIIGIVEALEAIKAAGDISPQLVMSGAIVSFYAPIWGFIVFIISMLLYSILKEIVKHKSVEKK